jgi:hypothetical protein
MNVAQTDEAEKFRCASLVCIRSGLRDYYGDDSKGAIPGRFTELLQRLEESMKADSENRDRPTGRNEGL